MNISVSDFDEAYSTAACPQYRPVCKGNNCFVASYPPVSKPGTHGTFLVNSYLVQPERKAELAGPVPVRSQDFK
jgi:hypothetical protein